MAEQYRSLSLLPKLMAIITLVVVVITFVMMVLGRIPMIFFWAVMTTGAVLAFWVIPRLRKVIEKKEEKR
jgi:archaellum biogenesis protein FlaJ (TadC family)